MQQSIWQYCYLYSDQYVNEKLTNLIYPTVDAGRLLQILLLSAIQLLKSAVFSLGGGSFPSCSKNHLKFIFISVVNLVFICYQN